MLSTDILVDRNIVVLKQCWTWDRGERDAMVANWNGRSNFRIVQGPVALWFSNGAHGNFWCTNFADNSSPIVYGSIRNAH
jgi:hypothetical protein